MARKTLAAIVLYLNAGIAQSQTWPSVDNGWVFRSTDEQAKLGYTAVRFLPKHVSFQLHETRSIIVESDRVTQTGSFQSGDTSFDSLSYSLDQVWTALQDGKERPFAAFSVGYLLETGVPQVAGFTREQGTQRTPFFNAPNLSALFCSDANFIRAEEGLDESVGQIPYLFEVDYISKLAFRTIDGNDLIEKTIFSDARQRKIFNSCESVIQVGPRIIDPRRVGVEDGLSNRQSREIFDAGSRPLLWNVFAWDLTGAATVITTKGDALLINVARAIEDGSFYSSRPEDCHAEEPPPRRSKSCEYFATVLSTFGAAGSIVVLRDGQTIRTGEQDTVVPYVLALYEK